MTNFTRKTTALVVLASALIASPAVAKGRPSPKPSEAATPVTGQITQNIWLSPQVSATAIQVQPGSTIPIKFRLLNGMVELKSTAMVKVTLTAISCATETVAPSTVAPAAPGKSSKVGALRYLGSSFQQQWKLAKSLNPGCYRFDVSVNNVKALEGAKVRVLGK